MTIFKSFTKKKIFFLIYLTLNSFTCVNLYAKEYQSGKILINYPYSTPTRPGTNNGVMYITNVKNTSKIKDELIGVSTPIANLSEIHSMKKIDGMMKMRKISSIELPSNEMVSVKKGNKNGYHIMLFDLKNNLKYGDNFIAVLHFKNAKSLKVNVEVIMENKTHVH